MQVELPERHARRDRALSQIAAEELEVVRLDVEQNADPDDGEQPHAHRDVLGGCTEGEGSEDGERRERLSAALSDGVDDCLEAFAHRRRQWQVQHLARRSMERVPEAPVGALQEENRDERRAGAHPGDPEEQEDRQDEQRPVHPHHAEQERREPELDDERDRVEPEIEAREEERERARIEALRDDGLEDPVRPREHDRAEDPEREQAPEVRLAPEQAHPAPLRVAPPRLAEGRLARTTPPDERQERSDEKRSSRDEDEPFGCERGDDALGDERAERRPDHAARSDDAEDALRLGDGHHLTGQEPQLNDAERRHETAPDVDDVEARSRATFDELVDPRGRERDADQRGRQEPPPVEAGGEALVDPRRHDGERRDPDVTERQIPPRGGA